MIGAHTARALLDLGESVVVTQHPQRRAALVPRGARREELLERLWQYLQTAPGA
jgi:hypothetical protein